MKTIDNIRRILYDELIKKKGCRPVSYTHLASKTITLTAIKQAFLNEECHMYTGEIAVEILDAKDLRQEQGLAKLVSPSWIKYHLKPVSYTHLDVYKRQPSM